MVHNLGNQPLDINTAVLPPSSRRLSSIGGTICHCSSHFRPNNETHAGDFSQSPVNLPAPGSSIFIFIYSSPNTAAELRVSSRPLLSAQPVTRSPPPAGGRSSRPPTSLGHAPVFNAAKPHSLPASAPQPSPRLFQLQRKYAAGPLASSFRCYREAASVSMQPPMLTIILRKISKGRYVLIKVAKRPRKDIGC